MCGDLIGVGSIPQQVWYLSYSIICGDFGKYVWRFNLAFARLWYGKCYVSVQPKGVGKMKMRRVVVAAVYAQCGKCSADLTDPNGSLMLEPGEPVKCFECGTVNEWPAALLRETR